MQIDSHHRFVPDWDTDLIEMLHSTDSGEMAVLTAYLPGFDMADQADGYSDFEVWDNVNSMRWY